MSGGLWEALLTSPQPQPAAQGRNPQLSRWSFITSIRTRSKSDYSPLNYRSVTSWSYSFIWKKERKEGRNAVLCPFIKLTISLWLQTEFLVYFCLQRIDLHFSSSEYLSRPDDWKTLKCSIENFVMFWLGLFLHKGEFGFCLKTLPERTFSVTPLNKKERAAERRRAGWVGVKWGMETLSLLLLHCAYSKV